MYTQIECVLYTILISGVGSDNKFVLASLLSITFGVVVSQWDREQRKHSQHHGQLPELLQR